MIFAFLGSIRIGVSALTGPTGSDETRSNDFVEHAVTRGKPVLQDMGEALDTRQLTFFFDETFCSPGAEYSKLLAAIASRSPMPLVFGNGVYLGKSFVVKDLKVGHRKTTQSGSLVRLEATVLLVEAPVPGLLSFAAGGAVVLGQALINPMTRR